MTCSSKRRRWYTPLRGPGTLHSNTQGVRFDQCKKSVIPATSTIVLTPDSEEPLNSDQHAQYRRYVVSVGSPSETRLRIHYSRTCKIS